MILYIYTHNCDLILDHYVTTDLLVKNALTFYLSVLNGLV